MKPVSWLLFVLLFIVRAALAQDCERAVGSDCLRAFDLPGAAGRLHYYSSRGPGEGMPQAALVVLHGHPRDAGRSFAAGLEATQAAGQLPDTLVIAPLYQVGDAARCHSPGVPAARAGDALWTCASWLAGEPSLGAHPVSAFAALDALVVELVRQWPGLRQITLAGFSAGAQMLQHSIGFAAPPPAGVEVRYVIADPGSWLYFDPLRPVAGGAGYAFRQPAPGCPGYDDWKYGTHALPAWLPRSAAEARARYGTARIDYLVGERDDSAAKGAYYRVLDKSCAAQLQGPFRLQRAQAYVAYEKALLKPVQPRRMVVVPGCGHDVSCVLTSPEARNVLFPAVSSSQPLR
ncbi:hypothetical protein V0R50_12185 [Pseudomonas sp. 148P]|uniref:AB hydrolase-1 domain-containing protein n=1 Tax=Pseudomonas ulcerans TaxID=3115852 RepID=A0ABU7HR25_9PSED|nr:MULTISPECIES: hypothetical protein [unclassified Pseudomonas]MEE1923021.1 hypothetical protein [Pseudomonas sp. 147P]MEE1933983.1 hypothetical protein [Pseudomonas sp. 148P]